MTDDATPLENEPGPSETPPEPEPEAPKFMTVEDVAALLEKQDHNLKTWIGRRDAELVDKITTKTAPPPDPSVSRDNLLENPDGYIDQALARHQQKQTKHMQDVLMNAGNIMEQDPLFSDKELGSAVVKEIQKIAGSVDNTLPPGIAAKQLVSDAALAVYRRKSVTPKNPLEGNTPTKGIGNVDAPNAQPTKEVKAPDLSPLAAKMAKKWGYKPETLAKIYNG